VAQYEKVFGADIDNLAGFFVETTRR